MNLIQKWISAYRHFRCGGLEAAKRYFNEDGYNHVHLLSVDPPIVYLWWGRDDENLHIELRDSNLTVLYLFPWCFLSNELPGICQRVNFINRRFPNHKIYFLCNEEYSVDELRSVGLNAEFIHQNAFINENIFAPSPFIMRTHDAIYSASLAPYKRHYLASDVHSLILLSYTYTGTSKDHYSNSARKALTHAWWPKDSLAPGDKLTTMQIVDLYAQAHVGLCLSAIEGGMFVSMEYLLSGLPIVSTKSVGGRDAFWDERYVVVCDDTPDSVAKAVQVLKHRDIAPDDIRRWTLEKVEIHRKRLRMLLSSLGAEYQCPWPPGSHGTTSFTNLCALGRDLRKNHSVNAQLKN
jgi:glycosyltransferase involved in cell wall biosynthesis